MGTKRTKKEEPVVPAAKPAPKRKVIAGPAAAAPRKPVTVVPEEPAKPVKAAKATKAPVKTPEPKAVKTVKEAKPKVVKAAKSASAAAPEKLPAQATKPAPKAISIEAIALRAYFIGEARQSAGLPGDSTTDWLEAERLLQSER